jgi:hypothetical protein
LFQTLITLLVFAMLWSILGVLIVTIVVFLAVYGLGRVTLGQ